MIYFDNASTSYPKPKEVVRAVEKALKITANPGRGAHELAKNAAQVIFQAREDVARLLNIDSSKNIIFTSNATEGLNFALKGLLSSGDHVITSSLEHNSVARPLYFLEKKGVKVTKIKYNDENGIDLNDLKNAIISETKAVCLTHISNVNGIVLPLEQIACICKKHSLVLLVDGAQAAGHFLVEPQGLGIDIYIFSGHKGLFGPTGTGAFYLSERINLPELMQGGTGSESTALEQPKIRPDRYECGTPNVSGIAGLGAGARLIQEIGLEKIKAKESYLTEVLIDRLKKIPGTNLYCSAGKQAPVLSFNVETLSPKEVALRLDKEHNIATRAGLHCAPDAHRATSTFPEGSVRVSLNYFNEEEEIDKLSEALVKIIKAR